MTAVVTAEFRFWRFLISRSLGSLCDQFLLFAVPLAILDATNSPQLSAAAFVIEWIPRVVGFPVIGSIIDGVNLRKTFIGLDLLRACAVVIAVGVLHFADTFATLSVLMALMSLGYVTNFLGIEAVIPNNLEQKNFPRAHSAVQAVEQGSQVLGPVFAVVVYRFAGINAVLLCCAVLFVISAVNLTGVRIHDSSAENSASATQVWRTNKLAAQTLARHPAVLYLSGMTWVVNIVYGTTLAIAASVVVKYFNESSGAYGLMQSVAAVAAIAVFVVVPIGSRRLGVSIVGRVSLVIMIGAGFVLGLSSTYLVFAIGYCALIAFDGGFNVYVRTMRSTVLPREHLGKVMGIVGAINLLSIPLGGVLATTLSTVVSLPTVILVATVASVVLCALLLVFGRVKLGYAGGFPPVEKPVEATT